MKQFLNIISKIKFLASSLLEVVHDVLHFLYYYYASPTVLFAIVISLVFIEAGHVYEVYPEKGNDIWKISTFGIESGDPQVGIKGYKYSSDTIYTWDGYFPLFG